MNKAVFQFVCIAVTLTFATLISTPTYAATAITVTSANKVVTIGLRSSGPLNTILATHADFIYVESANKIINIRAVQPPAALVSLYATRFAAIFVESADNTVSIGATTPATAMTETYAGIKKHITVEGADNIGLKSVVPIILDGGVPTGTVTRVAILPAGEAVRTPTTPAVALLPSITAQSTPPGSETPTPAP